MSSSRGYSGHESPERAEENLPVGEGPIGLHRGDAHHRLQDPGPGHGRLRRLGVRGRPGIDPWEEDHLEPRAEGSQRLGVDSVHCRPPAHGLHGIQVGTGHHLRVGCHVSSGRRGTGQGKEQEERGTKPGSEDGMGHEGVVRRAVGKRMDRWNGREEGMLAGVGLGPAPGSWPEPCNGPRPPVIRSVYTTSGPTSPWKPAHDPRTTHDGDRDCTRSFACPLPPQLGGLREGARTPIHRG
jgi:hypothetical protein